MDKIFLSSLCVECIVGIWEWERRVKQKVIIDLQMPGQAGVETIGLIRDLSEGVPIIAVSGYPMALEDAKVIGATRSLSKPFSVEELLAAVRTLLDEKA